MSTGVLGSYQNDNVLKYAEFFKPPSPELQTTLDASDYTLKDAPPTIGYIRDFIGEDLEKYLLEQFCNHYQPVWTVERVHQDLDNNGKSDSVINAVDFPEWFSLFIDPIAQIKNLYPTNFNLEFVCLHKYYASDGISPHRDFERNRPIQWIFTLGSQALLDFYQPNPEETMDSNGQEIYLGSVLLEPRSLIMIAGDANDRLMHAIKKVEHDFITENVWNRPANIPIGTLLQRQQRISITNGNYFHG